MSFAITSSTKERTLAFSVGLSVAVLAIDSRSFWIDEFGTWVLTQQDTLEAWWHAFSRDTSSDGQLPLYHFYMYVWSNCFGWSELALRFSNIPWFILAAWGVLQAPLPTRVRVIWLGILSLHSFAWFYLNEARPYIAFIAGASLACSGSLLLLQDPTSQQSKRKSVALFFVGCTVLIGASILGALWIASLTLAVLWFSRHRPRDLVRTVAELWWLCLPCLAIGTAIAVIATISFISGARAATMGFSPLGIIYGLIEALGLSGLGPSRNELRTGIGRDTIVGLLPMLFASALAAMVVITTARRLPLAQLMPAAFAVLAPIVALAVLGDLLSMRVVGRHFAFVIVPLTLVYAFAFATLDARLIVRNAALVVLAACLGASTLLIRFSTVHQKEDYAGAARYAAAVICAGGTVWWAADDRGAAYYRLVTLASLRNPTMSDDLVSFPYLHRRSAAMAQSEPVAILLSKPESYDADGFVRGFIRDHNYHEVGAFPGFRVFGRGETRSAIIRSPDSAKCSGKHNVK